MTWANGLNWGLAGLHIIVQVALVMRILLRRHREPASRIAWVAVVMAMPIMGILAYLLLGETSVGRKLSARDKRVLARLPKVRETSGKDHPDLIAEQRGCDAWPGALKIVAVWTFLGISCTIVRSNEC